MCLIFLFSLGLGGGPPTNERSSDWAQRHRTGKALSGPARRRCKAAFAHHLNPGKHTAAFHALSASVRKFKILHLSVHHLITFREIPRSLAWLEFAPAYQFGIRHH